MNIVQEKPIAAHVPPSLVRADWPFVFGTRTTKDPFNEIAPKVHAEEPDIVYALHAYPGGSPAWVPRRMAILREIYQDHEHFSANDNAPYAKLVGGTWQLSPASLDLPHHALIRQMANPAFTAKAMAALEGRIRGYAREYIDAFASRGYCEFMEEFAFEFPIKVFMELMGLPTDRVKEFLEWEHAIIHSEDLITMADAIRNVTDYLRTEIEDRRRHPRKDLITYGVQARIEGRRLTDDELMGFLVLLFIGGLDTVSTNLGHQIGHLARYPEHQQFLRANKAEIPHVIEELMRAYSSVTNFRICKKEVEIAGLRFMPGDQVAISTTLAGRDPAEFESPNEVRLDRRPRHTGFGFGIHTCLGMHLARRELRVAMEEFLAHIPDFRVAPDHQMQWTLGVIQPVELPLVWKPL